VVRYLVVLECFLIVLLISPWLGSALPRDSRSVEQSPDQIGTYAASPGNQSPEQPQPGRGRDAALSPTDRAMLAGELLGLPGGASSAAQSASSPRDDVPAPTGIYSASLADGSAAPQAPVQMTNRQSPAQAGRATGEGDPALSSARVATAQRLLARLGYSPGAADGVLGERTRRAIQDYRRRTGAVSDDLLSDALIAELRRDAHRVGARESQPRRIAPQSPRDTDRAPGWVASVAGGFQRLLGHEFDSKKQPGRIREYCRANKETWIFDEGRRAFAYCGHLAAAR
jgi:Putative peptidoglycan binding domain